MTENHPITPTLKLFRKWTEYRGTETEDQFWWRIATQATRWGSDEELEACCEWLMLNGYGAAISRLRAARRPKPPSLKEQALDELHISFDRGYLKEGAADTIRRALEALPE